MLPESSWEVSLHLPDQAVTYVFVLSIMAVSTDIILHLVRKTAILQVVDFCLIGPGESYVSAQEKIYGLVVKELAC